MVANLRNNVLQYCVLVLVSLAIAAGPGAHLLSFAYRTGDQSYILLIPAISIALVYRDRERIFARVSTGVSVAAAAFFVGAIALIAIGYASAGGSELQLATTALGLLAFWAGAFIVCFGVEAARRALFPLGMMLWIVPIPAVPLDAAISFLQKGSAELVDLMFRMTGVPFLRDGFVFTLPGQAIEVAKECSGIHSSLSMMIVTLIIAHECLASNWRRGALLLFTIPLTIVKNGIRIVFLTLAAIYIDPSFLTGRLHHEGGIVFFLIGMVILLPVLALLRVGDAPSKSAGSASMQTAAAGQD